MSTAIKLGIGALLVGGVAAGATYMWMGLVWMDGMDIIGHMSFKSTFSANGYHYHPHCSSGITGHYHHAYQQKDIQILGRKKVL